MATQDLIAFKQFYTALHPSLLNFANYMLHSRDDAKEVVNDVFVKIWDQRLKLGPFDENAANRLKAYAFQAVKNASLNKLRQQQKTWLQLDQEITDPQLSDDALHAKELQEQLDALVNHLPPKCKQVFLMSRVDQLPNKEIAELLEISVKTVENQMTKALKFFRKNLKNE